MNLILLFSSLTQEVITEVTPSITSRLSTGDLIALIAITVTVVSGIFWLIFRMGSTYRTVLAMETHVVHIAGIRTKMEVLWQSHLTRSNSPMQLNDVGEKILKDSHINKFVDEYFDEIYNSVKNRNPANAYQAQQITIEEVRLYKENKECIESLEQKAFNAGSDIDTILFVAAIYIRDKIIGMLDFRNEDIDKHDPKAAKS